MNEGVHIEAFVLAGGKSSRMGQDKGLSMVQGKPMISYVLKILEDMALPSTIIAGDERYHRFGLPVVADVIDGKGPMGGLHTALHYAKKDIILLLSCDMPLISRKALEMLLPKANKVSIVAASAEHRINPLFALYPVKLKEKVEEAIWKDHLKMTDFILENKYILVPSIGVKMPWCFNNINTNVELRDLEEKWDHLI